MRKRNSVKQLNRTYSHRKAMMRNMVTSLFEHERITTTRARGKVLQSHAEKLITRAKRNLQENIAPEAALHNKRQIMRVISDRSIVVKLFEVIAPRYKARDGGYTRIIHLPERQSDSAKMSIIELVDRTEKVRKTPVKDAKRAPIKKKDEKVKETEKKEKSEKKSDKDEKEQKRRKWFWNFRKNKGEDH